MNKLILLIIMSMFFVTGGCTSSLKLSTKAHKEKPLFGVDYPILIFSRLEEEKYHKSVATAVTSWNTQLKIKAFSVKTGGLIVPVEWDYSCDTSELRKKKRKWATITLKWNKHYESAVIRVCSQLKSFGLPHLTAIIHHELGHLLIGNQHPYTHCDSMCSSYKGDTSLKINDKTLKWIRRNIFGKK